MIQIDKIILDLITIIHLIIIIFIIAVPFFGNNSLLFMHAIIIPFLMMHWIFNNNTCALTIIEKLIRRKIYGKDNEGKCITSRLIEPIYDFKNNNKEHSKVIYTIVIIVWIISISRLLYNYKYSGINSFIDFVKKN